jgi:quercetin dioxygenase-like cupin family protein
MSSSTARRDAYDEETMKRIPLPEHAVQEIFFNTDEDDERVWMPISDGVWSRPMMFNTLQGAWVTLLKAEGTGVVSRHRHPAPVTGYTLEGAWGYLEHEWTARPGSFLFEPAGETHTLVVDPEVGHMKCLFHNFGPLIYVDGEGNQIGYDDVFTRLERFKKYYKSNGLGEKFLTDLIR